MKQLVLDSLTKFSCIGSACPNTCCKEWLIGIEKEKADYYLNVSGEFGDRLRANIFQKDGNYFFKLKEDNTCAFLDENALCDIYKNLGEDSLCGTCAVFPRTWWEIGDLSFSGLDVACPEAARIVLMDTDVLEFAIAEDDIEIKGLVDWDRYNKLVNAFISTTGILQDRSTVLSKRIVSIYPKSEALLNMSAFQFFDRYHSYLKAKDKLSYTQEIENATFSLISSANFNNNLKICDIIDSSDFSGIFENYCVYFNVIHFIKEFDDNEPDKTYRELCTLVSLLACYFVNYKADMLVVSKVSREYEHSFQGSKLKELVQYMLEV